jgi:hypothetical protein
VKDLLLLERSANAVLYGKTGWQFETDPQLGWWVGWVERDNAIFAFALNMEVNGRQMPLSGYLWGAACSHSSACWRQPSERRPHGACAKRRG